jgi:HK97 family phage prohead protease
MKKAVASYPAEIRASIGEEKRQIVGKAVVYNSLSHDLGGFREMILPGAFNKTLSEESAKKAYWNHNSDRVLGSTKSGTLRLEDRTDGLYFEIDPPDWAEEHLESIKRGDVDQMSFGFRTIKDSWEEHDGYIIRKLHEVQLFEVSPVAMPAYPQTDAQARAIPEELLKAVAQNMGEENEQWRNEIRSAIDQRNQETTLKPDLDTTSKEAGQETTSKPDQVSYQDIDDRMAGNKSMIGVRK